MSKIYIPKGNRTKEKAKKLKNKNLKRSMIHSAKSFLFGTTKTRMNEHEFKTVIEHWKLEVSKMQ